MKLKEVFPEILGYEYIDDIAYDFRDAEVKKKHSGIGVRDGKLVSVCYKKWKGTQKYVHNWVELANCYAVGMNENPYRGLSFPVMRIKKK